MRLYLSAPMTGIKDFNRPAMLAAEKELKSAGFSVVNPARLPSGKAWQWYMHRALRDIPTCGAMAQLDGWRRSIGCMIELQIAYKYDLWVNPVDAYIDDKRWFLSR
jgi:hypothetical protein